MSSALTVYTYKSCDSCRQATKWLTAKGLPFGEKPIRDAPPTLPELRALLGHLGGERRRLCNTSGKDYREQRLGEVLETLSEADFLARLAANGNLIKRPVLLRAAEPARGVTAVGLAGFSAEAWAGALGV